MFLYCQNRPITAVQIPKAPIGPKNKTRQNKGTRLFWAKRKR